jgi:hypothetical protein
MGFTHLQIERNPWLGGYRSKIPVLSALCPQLNLLNPPKQNFWVRNCPIGQIYWNLIIFRRNVEKIQVSFKSDKNDVKTTRHFWSYFFQFGARDGAVIESLSYKTEGRGIDSRWCHWNFSLTSFWPHCGPGVYSASNRNEYQEYILGKGGRCVGLTILPPLCADCIKIWEPQPPGTLRACHGL